MVIRKTETAIVWLRPFRKKKEKLIVKSWEGSCSCSIVPKSCISHGEKATHGVWFFLWATYVQYIVLRCWYYTLIVCPRVQYDGIAVTLLRKYLFLMREIIEAYLLETSVANPDPDTKESASFSTDPDPELSIILNLKFAKIK